MEQSVPLFLTKLFAILQDNMEQKIMKFDESGKTLIVLDEDKLVAYLLPEYFGHSNLPSFLRQLNMYGFKKNRKGKILEFKHKHFKRDAKNELIYIKRRNEMDIEKPEILEIDTFDNEIASLKENQQNLQILMNKVAQQNVILLQKIGQHQIKLGETSQNNHAKFSMLSQQIFNVVQQLNPQHSSEIVQSLIYQGQQSNQSLDYMLDCHFEKQAGIHQKE